MTYLRHWAPPRDTLSDHDTFKLAVLNQISSKIDSTLSQIYEGAPIYHCLVQRWFILLLHVCSAADMTDKDLTISKPVVTSTRFFMLKMITDPARRAAGPWTTERSGWMLGIIVTCIYSYLITWAAENKYGPICLTKMAKQAFINSVEQYHNKSAKRTWMDSITFH